MPAKKAKKKTAKKAPAKKPAPKKSTAAKPKAKAESKAKPRAAKPKKTKPARPCKIPKCKRTYRAKGYCRAHYRKWRQGEYGKSRYKTCQASECRKPMELNRSGYCDEHFQSKILKKKSNNAAPPPEAPAEEAAAS